MDSDNMDTDDIGRRNLAAVLNDARVVQGLTWTQVAQRMGLSSSHLSRIRNDQAPLTDLTKAKIEKGMGWERGTVDRVLQRRSWVDYSPADQDFSTPAKASPIGTRYDDPGLQALWELDMLTESERRAAIFAVRAQRGEFDIQAEPGTDQQARDSEAG